MDRLDRIQDKILIELGRNRLTRKCILGITQAIQMIESHERQIETTHNEVHWKIQELIKKAGINGATAIYQYGLGLTPKEYEKICYAKPSRSRRMV